MNSKEAIIDKILNDANEIVTENITKANDVAKEKISKATSDVEAKKSEVLASLDALKETLINRRKTVANLDAKKAILTRKSEIIDDIFERSVEAVTKDKDYKNMIECMLMDYAEDGDEVKINERDKAIIDKKLVDKVAKAKGIKIELSKEFGDFGGGVMLVGKVVDKNLTIDSELKAMREDIEQEVAKILFGE